MIYAAALAETQEGEGPAGQNIGRDSQPIPVAQFDYLTKLIKIVESSIGMKGIL
jgi:hypothetical protein